jgi:hypothetical protein
MTAINRKTFVNVGNRLLVEVSYSNEVRKPLPASFCLFILFLGYRPQIASFDINADFVRIGKPKQNYNRVTHLNFISWRVSKLILFESNIDRLRSELYRRPIHVFGPGLAAVCSLAIILKAYESMSWR